jgi:hypothetical protein
VVDAAVAGAAEIGVATVKSTTIEIAMTTSLRIFGPWVVR